MKRTTLTLAAVAALAACTIADEPSNTADEPVRNVASSTMPGGAANEVASADAADVAIPGDAASRPAGAPDADEADQCGASRYQHLVGRPRSEIPAKPAGAAWRIACTGCPVTMDYSPQRMNIFYDAETERVDEVRCG